VACVRLCVLPARVSVRLLGFLFLTALAAAECGTNYFASSGAVGPLFLTSMVGIPIVQLLRDVAVLICVLAMSGLERALASMSFPFRRCATTPETDPRMPP